MTSSSTRSANPVRSNRMEEISPQGISYESTIDPQLDIIESATKAYAASYQGHRGRTLVNVANTKLHRVFRVERRGDTLIVTPRGDTIGFGLMEYQTELNHVLDILEDPEIQNLLVDLGFANYFGSQMIGAVNSMIVKVRNAGGQAGVCDVSEDMLEGLSVMNLHEFWTIFATRNDAIRLLVTEPVTEKIGRLWKWIVSAAVVVLVGVGIGHFNFDMFGLDDTNVRYYKTITAIHDKYRALKSKDTNKNEWKIFRAQANDDLQPIYKELQKSEHFGNSPKMFLFFALQEGLMPIIHDPSIEHAAEERVYLYWMLRAREKILSQEAIEAANKRDNRTEPNKTVRQHLAKKSQKKTD